MILLTICVFPLIVVFVVKSGYRVCDEWNKLPGWVVNVESMNIWIIISGITGDLNKFC